jgi:acetylornithine deacetylase/succinyl-diaminopimelate desuccinylase-like protein
VELRASGDAGYVGLGARALERARGAFAQGLGTRPVRVRSGGTIPVVVALTARGIPAIVTGFTRPAAQLHSPNENIPASALREGLETTVETLRRLGQLG